MRAATLPHFLEGVPTSEQLPANGFLSFFVFLSLQKLSHPLQLS